MSDKKKNTPKKQKDSKSKKEKKENEIDEELDQSFPASDPPSHSRPGHDRTKENKS